MNIRNIAVMQLVCAINSSGFARVGLRIRTPPWGWDRSSGMLQSLQRIPGCRRATRGPEILPYDLFLVGWCTWQASQVDSDRTGRLLTVLPRSSRLTFYRSAASRPPAATLKRERAGNEARRVSSAGCGDFNSKIAKTPLRSTLTDVLEYRHRTFGQDPGQRRPVRRHQQVV